MDAAVHASTSKRLKLWLTGRQLRLAEEQAYAILSSVISESQFTS